MLPGPASDGDAMIAWRTARAHDRKTGTLAGGAQERSLQKSPRGGELPYAVPPLLTRPGILEACSTEAISWVGVGVDPLPPD